MKSAAEVQGTLSSINRLYSRSQSICLIFGEPEL